MVTCNLNFVVFKRVQVVYVYPNIFTFFYNCKLFIYQSVQPKHVAVFINNTSFNRHLLSLPRTYKATLQHGFNCDSVRFIVQ